MFRTHRLPGGWLDRRTTRGSESRPLRSWSRRLWTIESLEARTLLSTYTVNSIGDSGTGTGLSGDLRYVINQVDQAGGDNTINFAVTGTITLESALPHLSDTTGLTDIEGPGATSLTVARSSDAGTPDFSVFTVDPYVQVKLVGLTISGGEFDFGGGIYNLGTLTVTDSTVANNSAGQGGGIENDVSASLTIANSTITGNSTLDGGTGGGIIDRGGTLTITNSTIVGNQAAGDGSAGGIFAEGGTVIITGSTIADNTAGGYGGGIVSEVDPKLFTGTLTIANSTISGNNSTGGGGGIGSSAMLSVNGSTISGNAAGYGGGIDNQGTLTATDSTIADNSAGLFGGAINDDGTLVAVNCTIAYNNVASGGSGGGLAVGYRSTATLYNTIVALNTNGTGSSPTPDDIILLSGTEGTGTISPSSAYNLIGTGGSGGLTNGANGNLVGVADPGLAPLGDYEGSTQTIGLLSGSPAIDGGNNSLAVDPSTGLPLTTDQRGTDFPRIVNGKVDIGAYEFPGVTNDWTIMVYMTASVNLEQATADKINQMEALTLQLPTSVHFVVFYDQNALGPEYSTGGGTQPAWGDAGEAVIQGDADLDQIATTFIRLGEQDTGAPATLTSFVEWAAAREPSSHYALVMCDHGNSIGGSNWDVDNGGDTLSTPEMASALRDAGVSFDVIAFDACLMATAEVAYGLAPFTADFVASEEEGLAISWYYGPVDSDSPFSILKTNPAQVTADELASAMVARYPLNRPDDTLSAIHTSGVGALTSALNAFTSAVMSSTTTAADWGAIQLARDASTAFIDPDQLPNMRDLGQFMDGVVRLSANSAIKAAAQGVLDALDAAVLAKTNSSRHVSGLTIYLPGPGESISPVYSDHTAFSGDATTGWLSFLNAFTAQSPVGPLGSPDWAEYNDVAASAYNLHKLSGYNNDYANLNILPSYNDWFKFTTLAPGSTGDQVIIAYDASLGHLHLVLYSASDPSTPLGQSSSGSGSEAVSLAGLSPGDYLIDVYEDLGSYAYIPYTLTVDAPQTEGPITPDWAAGNATFATAYDLGGVGSSSAFSGLTIEPGLQDWFTFETPVTVTAQPIALSVMTQGQSITVELGDAQGNLLRSRTGKGQVQLGYLSGTGESYALSLSGAPGGYSLFFQGLLLRTATSPQGGVPGPVGSDQPATVGTLGLDLTRVTAGGVDPAPALSNSATVDGPLLGPAEILVPDDSGDQSGATSPSDPSLETHDAALLSLARIGCVRSSSLPLRRSGSATLT